MQKNDGDRKEQIEEFDDDLLPEYDLAHMKGAVRGKYVDRYRAGTNIIFLEPDVAKFFPTAESVNQALRMLIQIAQRQAETVADETNASTSASNA